jgi:hypothetical protein
MARTYGRTRSEMEADSIGRQLAKALDRLETWHGDPDMILDAARLMAESVGAKEAVEALEKYYGASESEGT